MIVLSFLLTLLFTTFIFSFAIKKKNNYLMTIAYGPAFIFTGIILSYISISQKLFSHTSFLILALISIWGIRLSLRLYKRNKDTKETKYYSLLREKWSKHGHLYFFIRSYLQIFLLQALLITTILLPFTLSLSKGKITILTLLGLIIWIIGFFFEAVGDAELDAFTSQRNKHGQSLLTTGLFSYTRHPNYFGESMIWTGLSLVSFASGASLFVFSSPFLVIFLLLFVSGIPRVEKKLKGNTEWEEYKKRTNAFLPFVKIKN